MTRLISVFVLLTMFFVQLGLSNGTSDLKLRLTPNLYDPTTQSIYVNLEIAYDGAGQFALADQNYRLYFDAKTLSLDTDDSNSDLPLDQYSSLQFHEVLENIDADEINQLSFDNHLGFVNFSIDLVNDINGGLTIKKSHGWERVAVLKFRMDGDDPSEIVWGRKDATNEYATAYVQIMEWKGPNWSVPVDVEFFEDAIVDLDSPLVNDIRFDISPNPSIDFIRLEFDEKINGGELNIYNILGGSVYDLELVADLQVVKIPTSDFPAGTYTVEVKDLKTGVIRKESFIKVKK